MAICDTPIPRGLYSDGRHWIYFKIERQPDVIMSFCHQVDDVMAPEALVEITSITMYDFTKVSVSEMNRLMREFLIPYKHGKCPVVWKLSTEHNGRLTSTRKKMFMGAQENIAHACGFRKVRDNSNEVTNKYYYYA